MDNNLLAVLTLAFGLGMLHALDADHIAAVSALACLLVFGIGVMVSMPLFGSLLGMVFDRLPKQSERVSRVMLRHG